MLGNHVDLTEPISLLAGLMEENRRLKRRIIDAEHALAATWSADCWYWHRYTKPARLAHGRLRMKMLVRFSAPF